MVDNALCLRSSLLADRITLSQLAKELDSLISAAPSGMAMADLKEAYSRVIAFRNRAPRGADGIRYLESGDELRPSLCRLLFHIPIESLRRREERLLEIDPPASASPAFSSRKKEVTSREDRLSSRHVVSDHADPDPGAFTGYVGHQEEVSLLLAALLGEEARGDHHTPLLLTGPSGVGKSELAGRVARRLGGRFIRVAASLLRSGEDVEMLLEGSRPGDTVLVDEAQALPSRAATVFFDAISKEEEDILLIFATNLPSRIPAALRNRCREVRLGLYSVDDLREIVVTLAEKAAVTMETGVAEAVAIRSHGIPRVALGYARDLVASNGGQAAVSLTSAEEYFSRRGIDKLGLDGGHRRYLKLLAEGKASLSTLCAALGENSPREVECIEAPLLHHGLIAVTSGGRVLTERGRRYLEGGMT